MSRSDIDALNATFTEVIAKGDAATVASAYAPDAQVLPPGSDVVTGDAIQEFWQGVMSAGLSGGTLETVAFEEHGDVAIERGAYTMQVGEESDSGKYVVVHRRQPDGSWKIGVDIWNSSRPEPDPAA